MLPRARRLAAKDVEHLMKEGRPVVLGALRMKYLKTPSAQARFAFVVSKKTARDAVTRNRLRRWGAVSAQTMRVAAVDAAISITKRYESLEALRTDLRALLARIPQ